MKESIYSTSKVSRQSSMQSLFWTTLFLIGLLTLPYTGHSEIHSYEDEHGSSVFVDDAYLSPAEQQSLQQKVLASEKAKRTSRTTPVKVYGNQVLVPVEISDGHRQITARLLLDTGASQTVFHRRVVDPLQMKSMGKGWAQLAGGQFIATERVRLDSLVIGPYTWEAPAVSLIEVTGSALQFDGLLGMDFLKKHHYRIDFQQQLIHWQATD